MPGERGSSLECLGVSRMRALAAGLLLCVTLFAVTSAAASSIDVTGPFNPSAGSASARACGIGPVAVTPDPLSGGPLELLTRLQLSTANAPTDGCEGAFIYVKTQNLLGGHFYMKIAAEGDYSVTPAYFYFDSEAGHPNKVYNNIDMASEHQVTEQPLLLAIVNGATMSTVNWLVTMNPPSSM